MKYKALFSITLSHSYFTEGDSIVPEIAKYIDLTPTPFCLSQIKRYRLRLLKKPGVWSLHTPILEDNSTFIPKESLNFQFYLKVLHPDFFHFTYFSEAFLKRKFENHGIPLYKSQEENSQLSQDWYEHQVVDVFSIREERATNDSFFLKHQPTQVLTAQNALLNGLGTPSPDFTYDAVLNKISFDTTADSYTDGQPFLLQYEAIPKWTTQTFGLVEIGVNGVQLIFEKAYKYTFSRKRKKWNYLIISPHTIVPNELVIENGSAGDNAILFDEAQELLEGDHYARLKAAFPSAKIFRISSKGAIPFKKDIRKGIKLKKEGDLLIKDLPNPSPSNQGIEIINIYS